MYHPRKTREELNFDRFEEKLLALDAEIQKVIAGLNVSHYGENKGRSQLTEKRDNLTDQLFELIAEYMIYERGNNSQLTKFNFGKLSVVKLMTLSGTEFWKRVATKLAECAADRILPVSDFTEKTTQLTEEEENLTAKGFKLTDSFSTGEEDARRFQTKQKVLDIDKVEYRILYSKDGRSYNLWVKK